MWAYPPCANSPSSFGVSPPHATWRSQLGMHEKRASLTRSLHQIVCVTRGHAPLKQRAYLWERRSATPCLSCVQLLSIGWWVGEKVREEGERANKASRKSRKIVRRAKFEWSGWTCGRWGRIGPVLLNGDWSKATANSPRSKTCSIQL